MFPPNCASTLSRLRLFGFLAVTCTIVLAQERTFTTIDFPDAVSTRPEAINNLGQIVGEYSGLSAGGHGFLLDGQDWATIDYPGATYTHLFGINDNGQIIGSYAMGTSEVHSFLFDGENFTDLEFPGASSTNATRINNAGQILGSYTDADGQHGFVFDGEEWTTIDYPGGINTTTTGINDNGQIIGVYRGPNRCGFMFLLDGDEFTDLVLPWTACFPLPSSINNFGMIVGWYNNFIGDSFKGFLFDGEEYTVIEYPGASGTLAKGINDTGQIVGTYREGGPPLIMDLSLAHSALGLGHQAQGHESHPRPSAHPTASAYSQLRTPRSNSCPSRRGLSRRTVV